MDKLTLSKYGWAITTVIVIVIIAAFAPMIGERVSDELIGGIEDNVDYFAVVLDPNGGTVAFNDVLVVNGKPYGYLPTPSFDGKIFVGWYTSRAGGERITEQTIFIGSSDHKLYARWE